MKKGILAFSVVLLALLAGGCKRKPKAVALPPPPPPQVETRPGLVTPAPETKTEPAKPAEERQPGEEKRAEAPPTTPPAPKPATPRRSSTGSKQGTTTVAQNHAPGSHVPPPLQLEAPLSRPQEQLYRTRAQETIAETERHLAVLKTRKLSDEQQAMVKQAQTFLAQARQALADGDLVRGANLAHKAHLLSVELLGNTE